MVNYIELPYQNIDLYITFSAFYLSSVSQEELRSQNEKDGETLNNFVSSLKGLNKSPNKEQKEEDVSKNTTNNTDLDSTQKELQKQEHESIKDEAKKQSEGSRKESIFNSSLKITLKEDSIELSSAGKSTVDLSMQEETILPTFSLPIPSPTHKLLQKEHLEGKVYLKIPFDVNYPPFETDEVKLSMPFKRLRCYGIIGMLKLLTGWHLIVITKISRAGMIERGTIYHIDDIILLPFDYTLSALALEEMEIRNEKVELIMNNLLNDNNEKVLNLFDRLRAVVQSSSDKKDIIEEIEDATLSPKSIISEISIGQADSPKNNNQEWDNKSDISQTNNNSNVNDNNDNVNKRLSKSEDELLEQRIKKEILKLFGIDGNMYLSYDYDLTNSLQRKKQSKSEEQCYFWQTFDYEFWWNRPLQLKLIENNLNRWILPIIQGYVQTEQCEMDGHPFNLTVISRRGIRRLGMRYQRRGINDTGYVANFAETEQILELKRENEDHLCSFLQLRGSIPLFWSQSPYSLKPIPIMERGGAENLDAFILHIARLKQAYGDRLYLINLAEQTGRESIVSSAYRNYLEAAKSKAAHLTNQVELVEFDFHRETQGMDYENISKLINKLDHSFQQVGYYWHDTKKDTQFTEQLGIHRSNCMDCLDRTNVIQSSLARHMLNIQLFRLGIQEYPDLGLKGHAKFEATFNDLWANNGDAISHAYAGTSALKGDFTRTGKRNLQGLVNDATNSLSRFYINAFRDFFTQAVLDYLMGYHKLSKFREVASTHIATEPGLEERLQRVRKNAIEISANIVLLDGEVKLGGWTLLSPVKLNRTFHTKLEEKVVLLSSRSIYICSFHYGLEKVLQFTRIPLEKVIKLQLGAYYLKANELNEAESPSEGIPTTKETLIENELMGLKIYYNWDEQLDKLNNKSLRNRLPTNLLKMMIGNIGLNNTSIEGDNNGVNAAAVSLPHKSEVKYVALKGMPNLISTNYNSDSNDDNNEKNNSNSYQPIVNSLEPKEFNNNNSLLSATSSDSLLLSPMTATFNNMNLNIGTSKMSIPSSSTSNKENLPMLTANETILQAREQIELAYWTRVSEVQAKAEMDSNNGLEIVEETILSPDELRDYLYPASKVANNAKKASLLAVKRLGERIAWK